MGSGFVWDTQGNIVTNNHVVEGASEITVTFFDGTIVDAKLVGADPDSDLAVIKVTNAPANYLKPITLADSSQVKVGQIAIAIGNPFGEQNTMTTGIISALGRSLPSGRVTTGQGNYQIPDVIQTEHADQPGQLGRRPAERTGSGHRRNRGDRIRIRFVGRNRICGSVDDREKSGAGAHYERQVYSSVSRHQRDHTDPRAGQGHGAQTGTAGRARRHGDQRRAGRQGRRAGQHQIGYGERHRHTGGR